MNDVNNVTVGKPKIGGAVFNAVAGTTAPTSTADALAAAFKALGYVSEDGITNSNSPSTETIKAWGGDVVAVPQSEKADTFKLKLIEAMNTDVLSVVFGSGNVSGTLETGLAISANSEELPESVWVIDMILRGNVAKRIVIPAGKISEIADVVYKDNEVVGYELTLTALPDSAGNTHYEYLKKVTAT